MARLGTEDAQSVDNAEYFRVVGNTGRRMLAMVEDVLDFSTTGGDLRLALLSLPSVV